MTQTMSDGIVNIIEHKVIKTFSTMTKTYAFGGQLQNKIDEICSNDEKLNSLTNDKLMGWKQVDFDDPISIEYKANE